MPDWIDHPLLNEFLFYPRSVRESEIPPLDHGKIHIFPSGGGEKISAYLYRPLPDAPTLLLFHGNGEVVTDYIGEFTEIFRRMGLNVCVVDYRGYGLSEGEPSLGKILEDGRAAWEYFSPILGDRIILFGRSMGSIPAIDVASRAGDGYLGLIIESGIAGFGKWIERMEPLIAQAGIDVPALKAELNERLDHRAKIQAATRPILILHTELDSIVPSWNARDLYEWAGPAKAQLRVFEEGDHNSIFYHNGEEYIGLVKSFVKRVNQRVAR